MERTRLENGLTSSMICMMLFYEMILENTILFPYLLRGGGGGMIPSLHNSMYGREAASLSAYSYAFSVDKG